MKKIILFTGGVETLTFFSLQIKKALTARGYKTFLFDISEPFDSFQALLQFCRKGEGVLVTFNFIGLSGESIFFQNGISFFDEYAVKCLNIVVDHPFYYHEKLRHLPSDYLQFCIDRTHIAYMRRFFPHVTLGEFLPLAGTVSAQVQHKGCIPIAERKTDLLFVGNYTPPQHFEKQITRLGNDYTQFYYGIIDDLTAHSELTMEQAFEDHIKREIPDISDADLAKCMENMIFIDLYLRFTMRGRVIEVLADNGFPIEVFGAGMELLSLRHPENLLLHGSTTSAVCLNKLSKAKISLNVMPWFKDGLHDRILSASLNGAVSLTDTSGYLCEVFSENDLCCYSLKEIEKLPETVTFLLEHPAHMQQLADNAKRICAAAHTWENRVDVLESYL